MDTLLSKNGYSISKKFLDEKEQKKIEKELTFKPFDPSGYTDYIDNSFGVWRQTEDRIYVPRYWGINKWGIPKKDTLNKKDIQLPIKFIFSSDKNDPVKTKIQKDAIDTIVPELKKNGGYLLSLPCGYGKTYTAIRIWTELKVKVLILVHKEFLAEQFEQDLRKFVCCDDGTPIKIGKIQGKKCDTEDCHVVIGMIQSIMENDYPNDKMKQFQMCIIDECHHIAAPSFSKTLNKICCKYMLGLSATPDRDDKLDTVFRLYLSDNIFTYEMPKNPNVIVELYEINSSFAEEILDKKGKPFKSKMITNITKDTKRNEFIVDLIAEKIKQDRNILITSGRCGTDDNEENKHLDILAKDLLNRYKIDSVIYKGGDPVNKLEQMKTKKVLFSTYSMCSEGLNVPMLDTILLATPVSTTKQTRYRIMRKNHDTIKPLIIDLVDNFSNFKKQSCKRIAEYRKSGYKFKYFSWSDTDGLKSIKKNKITEENEKDEKINGFSLIDED